MFHSDFTGIFVIRTYAIWNNNRKLAFILLGFAIALTAAGVFNIELLLNSEAGMSSLAKVSDYKWLSRWQFARGENKLARMYFGRVIRG